MSDKKPGRGRIYSSITETVGDTPLVRLDRLALGNFGDAKSVGGGVSELRIDYGPGYRLYFMRAGQVVVVMLCGGDKTTQKQDIEAAQMFAKQWKA